MDFGEGDLVSTDFWQRRPASAPFGSTRPHEVNTSPRTIRLLLSSGVAVFVFRWCFKLFLIVITSVNCRTVVGCVFLAGKWRCDPSFRVETSFLIIFWRRSGSPMNNLDV